jgi:transposase
MNFVGIDIAKRSHEATVLGSNGKVLVKPFKLENSFKGFGKLLEKLNSVSPNLVDFKFGMEATGHYWLNLYCKLVDSGATAYVVNPVQSDALRGLYIRQTKTDSKDSFIVADLIRIGHYAETTLADHDLIALRELTRQRFYLVDCISAAKRKVISLIDKVFHEYETLFSDMFGSTSLKLLEKYPTPDLLIKVPTTKLANFLKETSRGRFGKDKATQIKDLAKNTFGTFLLFDSSAFAIKQFLEQVSLLERQLEEINSFIAELLPKFNSSLTTIDGIGTTLAATVIAEIGDVNRFDKPEKSAAFAGIDPSVSQSGEFTASKSPYV